MGSSAGIRCSSLAQAPRSMSRHRSEQNGLNELACVHLTRLWQVGQLIILGVSGIYLTVLYVGFLLVLVSVTGRGYSLERNQRRLNDARGSFGHQ